MKVIEGFTQVQEGTKNPMGIIVKVIISLVLALVPIVLSGIMTFVSLPLRGLYVFLIGILIGVLLIPFMLFITKQENWAKKWYIWIGMIITIVSVLAFPMLKSAGTPQMPGPEQNQMQGSIVMENGMS